jgi:hypothetical protein
LAVTISNGELLWWLSEGGDVPVASPILAGRVISPAVTAKYRPMRSVRLDATGDIKPPDISMTEPRRRLVSPAQRKLSPDAHRCRQPALGLLERRHRDVL